MNNIIRTCYQEGKGWSRTLHGTRSNLSMIRPVLLLCVAACVHLTSAGNALVDLYLADSHLLAAPPLLPPAPRGSRGLGLRDLPDTFQTWDYKGEDYPRPRNEANQCNVPGIPNASICDSDRTLNLTERESLQAKINSALAGQSCQCSSQQGGCSNDPVAGGRYSISIAIPEYLRFGNNPNTNQCAQFRLESFANTLRTNRYKDLAKCDDGIVIALSPADQVYTISVSSKPLRRLSSGCQYTIEEKVRPMMERREYSRALHDMVDYISHALKGGKCGEKSGLTSDQVVGIVCGVVFGTAFIVFVIMVCVGFFRNWKCVAGTCLGIIIGACLRAVQVAINLLIIKCMSALCERITSLIPACEGQCDCCQCEPLTCVEDVEAGGGGGGGW